VTVVDTSVWIEFFRGGARATRLRDLLEEGEVLVHPWILGEICLGSLGPRRSDILADLRRLPAAAVIHDAEVMEMVEARKLAGSGIGWVDAQILASALACGADLWTLDGELARTWEGCG